MMLPTVLLFAVAVTRGADRPNEAIALPAVGYVVAWTAAGLAGMAT